MYLCVKTFPHVSQPNDLSEKCRLRCFWSSFFVLDVFPQTSHLKLACSVNEFVMYRSSCCCSSAAIFWRISVHPLSEASRFRMSVSLRLDVVSCV